MNDYHKVHPSGLLLPTPRSLTTDTFEVQLMIVVKLLIKTDAIRSFIIMTKISNNGKSYNKNTVFWCLNKVTENTKRQGKK